MLTVVTDERTTRRAQRDLARQLRRDTTNTGTRSIGYQGGQLASVAHWNPETDLWMSFNKAQNRYWNAFGFGDPREAKGTLSIVVEINPPFRGSNRRVAGAFATDSRGGLYLLHRGKIGGGRAGVGMHAFIQRYRGALHEVAEAGGSTEFVVLGRLGDPILARSVQAFVAEVSRFKEHPSEAHAPGSRGFSPEFFGNRTVGVREAIEAKCRHGVVVNTLHELLERDGFKVTNNRSMDLCVHAKHGIAVLLEAKAATDPYSIYTGIGQLAFHAPSESVMRILVLPSDTDTRLLSRVRQLGIDTLLFEWRTNTVEFRALRTLTGRIRQRGST